VGIPRLLKGTPRAVPDNSGEHSSILQTHGLLTT
jgi:hypothetical protein